MTERMPLFPLGTVLFPGAQLPLHVFEERYRTMVDDLLALPENRPRRFGVVALKEGREVGVDGVGALHEVGCTAEVETIQAYDDGRFDLLSSGVERFRLLEVDAAAAPYLTGVVELLDEPDGEDAERLVGILAAAFDRYRDALGAGGPPEELPDDPLVLSYLIASATVLDLSDKQRLLAAEDSASRLRAERELLHRELGLLDALPSLPAADILHTPYNLS